MLVPALRLPQVETAALASRFAELRVRTRERYGAIHHARVVMMMAAAMRDAAACNSVSRLVLGLRSVGIAFATPRRPTVAMSIGARGARVLAGPNGRSGFARPSRAVSLG